MIKEISKYFHHNYLALRDEADRLCFQLERVHLQDLKCNTGCFHCCMDFRIFPVEFFSILKETEGRDIKINNEISEGACPFLINGLCSIYESRPVICRTHGLPLLYMGEDEWQMSWCELNFTGEDIPEFNESNTFPQDLYNSKMFMLNRKFISKLKEIPYKETDLISLSELGRIKRHNGIMA